MEALEAVGDPRLCCGPVRIAARIVAARLRALRGHATSVERHPARALAAVAGEGASVLVRGLDELDDDCWAVLATTRVRLVPVADVAGAVRAPTDRAVQVVIADARKGRALTAAKRRRELASVKPLEEFDFTF
jgi:hypothetical protein